MLTATQEMGEKRNADHLSPLPEAEKRYLWKPDVLLAQNKYHVLSIQTDIEDNSINTSQKTNKPLKIPPIFLQNATNHQLIIKEINSQNITNFTTSYKNNSLRINVTNSDDYRKLTKFYTDEKIEFHTFQNPNSRPLSVVLRNVPISLTEDEITCELNTHSLPIIRVTRLLNKDKNPMPLCAVELTATEKSNEIFNVKEISKAIITVEPRKKSHNIPQCHNCQNYGHTKNYCSRKSKCVKCGGEHNHKQCEKKKSDPPKCANCGGPHPANYRKCSYHTELQHQQPRPILRKQDITSQKPAQPSHQPSSSTHQPHNSQFSPMTYSQTTKQNQHQNTPNPQRSPTQSNNHININQESITASIMQFIKQLITPLIQQIKSFFINDILPNLLNV